MHKIIARSEDGKKSQDDACRSQSWRRWWHVSLFRCILTSVHIDFCMTSSTYEALSFLEVTKQQKVIFSPNGLYTPLMLLLVLLSLSSCCPIPCMPDYLGMLWSDKCSPAHLGKVRHNGILLLVISNAPNQSLLLGTAVSTGRWWLFCLCCFRQKRSPHNTDTKHTAF